MMEITLFSVKFSLITRRSKGARPGTGSEALFLREMQAVNSGPISMGFTLTWSSSVTAATWEAWLEPSFPRISLG